MRQLVWTCAKMHIHLAPKFLRIKKRLVGLAFSEYHLD